MCAVACSLWLALAQREKQGERENIQFSVKIVIDPSDLCAQLILSTRFLERVSLTFSSRSAAEAGASRAHRNINGPQKTKIDRG